MHYINKYIYIYRYGVPRVRGYSRVWSRLPVDTCPALGSHQGGRPESAGTIPITSTSTSTDTITITVV